MTTKLINFNGKILRVLADTDVKMFKTLTDAEAAEFVAFAVKNKTEIKSIFHPVIQDKILQLRGIE